jgi:hypothetical protein
MKLRERIKIVKFPVWNTHVKVTFTDNVFESIRKRDKSYTVADCTAMCMHQEGDDRASMLILDEIAPPNIIAHECWHAIHRLLTGSDAKLDNETVAYHLGYLVGEVHKFQRRCK